MEEKKNNCINKYLELKESKKGIKPKRNDFLKYSGINDHELERIFGRNPYSTLQELAGDVSNKLLMERSSLIQILEQYGSLVKKYKDIPRIADWQEANYKPTPDGISKVHKIMWTEMPIVFIEKFKGNPTWAEEIEILKKLSKKDNINSNRTKIFCEIVDKINIWTPDRKRAVEEGYKIEIRNYLEKYFNVEEESGDTNPDILINKKYPIEIKRDPSQSEYDRLLGQMIRHNKSFGSAIAIITNVSSQDRYKKFQKLFIEIHDKLGMTAELFIK